MSETTVDLVQQGLTATRVGDIEEAKKLLSQATRQMPENPEAWLALAGAMESLEEKKHCFNKVLELNPDNEEAQAGLALVEQKLEAEAEARHFHTGVGVCHRHPDTETALRCNRCNKLICPKCAQRTPVGFRCPDCIREQEDRYYTGSNIDYVIAVAIALPMSFIIAGLFTTILGNFGFFTLIIGFFAAPFLGGIIAEAVRWGVRKRRSRYLRHVVVGCLILGTAPFLLLFLISGNFFGMLLPGMLMFLGAGAISVRLR